MEQTNQNEMGKLIRIIVVIVAIFIVFYILTVLTTGSKKGEYSKKQTTPAIIQYDELLLGTIYNQKENNYYILIKEENDPYIELFEGLLSQQKSKEGGIPYYTVNLSSAFNQKYIGDVSSFDSNHLKVIGTTLLKITEHNIVERYETSETILEALTPEMTSKS